MSVFFFFFFFLAPDDLSLRVYRAEANLAMMHYSDALTDLDYLCCLRPNWTEVRHACCLDSQGKSRSAAIYIVLLWTVVTYLLKSSLPNFELPFSFSLPQSKSLLN